MNRTVQRETGGGGNSVRPASCWALPAAGELAARKGGTFPGSPAGTRTEWRAAGIAGTAGLRSLPAPM
jgi:hypothetical protein